MVAGLCESDCHVLLTQGRSIMDNTVAAFDPELFTQTASRFVLKRKYFPPAAVEALAGDVLRQLASPPAGVDAAAPPEITGADIEAFCTALIEPTSDAALRYIEARRAEGLTRMGVYLGYICAAARRLGEGWERDEYSFLDVTTGTGHLYALMRALRRSEEHTSELQSLRRISYA